MNRRNSAVLVATLALFLPGCGADPNSPQQVQSRLDEANKATTRKDLVRADTAATPQVNPAERLTGAELE